MLRQITSIRLTNINTLPLSKTAAYNESGGAGFNIKNGYKVRLFSHNTYEATPRATDPRVFQISNLDYGADVEVGDGQFTNVPTTSSGSGTGMLVSFNIKQNAISDARITANGTGYTAGERITINVATAQGGTQPFFDLNVSPRPGGNTFTSIQLPTTALELMPISYTVPPMGSIDVAEMYQMYRQTANRYPFLNDVDFATINPLCFKIQTHKVGRAMFDEHEETSIQFNAQLNAPPRDAQGRLIRYAVLTVGFYDSIAEIEYSGNVTTTLQ